MGVHQGSGRPLWLKWGILWPTVAPEIETTPMKPKTFWECGLRTPGADALFQIFHFMVNLHVAFKTPQLCG